jgi:hypothetical protein
VALFNSMLIWVYNGSSCFHISYSMMRSSISFSRRIKFQFNNCQLVLLLISCGTYPAVVANDQFNYSAKIKRASIQNVQNIIELQRGNLMVSMQEETVSSYVETKPNEFKCASNQCSMEFCVQEYGNKSLNVTKVSLKPY